MLTAIKVILVLLLIEKLQIEEVWKKTNGYLSFGIPKESPYGPFLKSKVLDMIQNGELQKLIKKWENKEPDCSTLDKKGKPLTLQKLISLFLIIATGCLLVLFIFIVENCTSYWRKDTSNDNALENFKKALGDIQDVLKNGRCPSSQSLYQLIHHSEKLRKINDQEQENKVQDYNKRIRIGDKYSNVNVQNIPYVKTRKKIMIMKKE